MNKPEQCRLTGTAQAFNCDDCSLCPEVSGYVKPKNWTAWEWCKGWMEVNTQPTQSKVR